MFNTFDKMVHCHDLPGNNWHVTPSDHLFPVAGSIASKRRDSLGPEHVLCLTVLDCMQGACTKMNKQNIKCI